MSRWWALVFVALLSGGPAAAHDSPATTEIGSWVLTCPSTCELRHRSWLVRPIAGGPTLALEVIRRGANFVPALALRGLSTQEALGAILAVHANLSLRFDDGPRRNLGCDLDDGAIVCSPRSEVDTAAADELAAARKVLIQAELSVPGVISLPELSRQLGLQGTKQALVRFRASLPASQPVPVVAGLGWRDYLDKLRRNLPRQENPHE